MAVSLPSVEEVRAVITTTATDAQVEATIEDAALIVETCVASLDEARQKAIVKYVTAHLLSVNSSLASGGSGALSSQSLGDASESYATAALGDGLFSTAYGKKAILFDPNGCISRLGKLPTIFKVL